MSENFHETYQDGHVDPPSPAATGYVFAVVAAIAAVLFRDTAWVLWPALACAVGFAVAARFCPQRLGPLNRAWFRFALMLNRIMSPVMMGVIFFTVIVPYGLAMQCVRDPLRARSRGRSESHWIVRDADEPIDLKAQF